MKQNFPSVLLLFLVIYLVSTSYSTARKLAITNEQGVNLNKNSNRDFLLQKENTNYSPNKLMEDEECPDKDEECLRRVILEAHLDYIYTQHHKP